MRRVVECVPNFSEGRDPARIRALVASMSGIPGAFVLDLHSDADHNRSVITVAGEPEAVTDAALRAIGKAVELIDLRIHKGEHPRIGAIDVLPFVPVSGVTMDECVAIAHRAGHAIWERYHVPVYFYEAAAMRPERVRLEALRKGQIEGLNEQLRLGNERIPDIGGARLHPTAGAVAVGARKYLIAFNVLLNTSEVSVARQIARAVRESSGGLPAVKAIGVGLGRRGRAQVSMNLTDFERTSVRDAFEAVTREAERHGYATASSEIVGLIPRRAIRTADVAALKLERFERGVFLEDKFARALTSPASGRILANGVARATLR